MGVYITSSEGRKQHSTCLAVQTLTKYRLCSPKYHRHASFQSVCVTVNALGSSKDIPGKVILIWQGHLKCLCWWSTSGRGCSDTSSPSCPWHVYAPGFGTSHQPRNSLGSHLNCRADPSWGGHRQQQTVLSLWTSKNMCMEPPLSNGGEWEKPACLPPTLRYLKERDNNLDVNNIKYWLPQSIPHNDCATNGDECTAKYFYISLKYRTMVKLKHQYSSRSKKSSIT